MTSTVLPTVEATGDNFSGVVLTGDFASVFFGAAFFVAAAANRLVSQLFSGSNDAE